MDGHGHLRITEREDVMVRWKGHEGVSQMARELHRDKPTISREIRRNGRQGHTGRRHRASTAQREADGGRLRRRRPGPMDEPERRPPAARPMRDGRWSPEETSGRIPEERSGLAVSDSAVCCAVESGRRGEVRMTHDVSERPEEASSRSRTGDREGDAVVDGRGGACPVAQADGMRADTLSAARPPGRPMPRPARPRGGRSRRRPASAIHAIHGSGAPTRAPMAFSETGSRRARASTTSATARCGRHAVHAAGGHASVSSGSAPGRSTTASRCTCPEDSPPFTLVGMINLPNVDKDQRA